MHQWPWSAGSWQMSSSSLLIYVCFLFKFNLLVFRPVDARKACLIPFWFFFWGAVVDVDIAAADATVVDRLDTLLVLA